MCENISRMKRLWEVEENKNVTDKKGKKEPYASDIYWICYIKISSILQTFNLEHLISE